MKTNEDIYNEVVGCCSQNQGYEKAIKARVLKAMDMAVEQSHQAAVSGSLPTALEVLKELFNACKNEMAAKDLPLEWKEDSPMGRAQMLVGNNR